MFKSETEMIKMTDCNSICVDRIDALKKYGISRISVAIGVFDGVHAGHRRLLAQLCEIADRTASTPVAVTFSPHPRQILQPDSAPALLLPNDEKIRRLTEHGVQAIVTIPFTAEFAAQEPEDFIADCLKSDGITLCGVCVGKNWRFGAGGRGNAGLLTELAGRHGFTFSPVAEVEIEGETVSSSSIRAAAAAGDLAKATRFLCAPYAIYGSVIHGEHVASTRLHTPTANLELHAGVLPPNGVYAALVHLENHPYKAVINIGSAPTFDSYGKKDLIRVEAHLLNSDMEIYGKNIAIEPVRFLRQEKRFASPEELKEQIRKDIEHTAVALAGKEKRYAN